MGAVFRLEPTQQQGETVATLWAKEGDYWKLISYDVEPEFEKLRSPNLAATSPVAPPLEYVNADPALIKATDSFLKDWFVRRRADEAVQYFSAKSNECVNLYRSDDRPAPRNSNEAQNMFLADIKQLADMTGNAKKLEDAILAPSPHHPDLKLVKHPEQKAFVIASIPDDMATIADCSKRTRGDDVDAGFTSTTKHYGNFYGVGFSLARNTQGTAVLWTIWGKESGSWKINSYLVLTP